MLPSTVKIAIRDGCSRTLHDRTFSPLAPSSANGFSLSEVLVAFFASTLFFLVTLQSTFISSRYQTIALEKSTLKNWIQSDLEAVQAQSRRFNLMTLTAPANTAQSSIRVNTVRGFDPSDWVIFAEDLDQDLVASSASPNQRRSIYRIAEIQANSLRLTTPLSKTYPNRAMVVKGAELRSQLTLDSPLHALQLQLADVSAFPPQSQLVIGDDTQIYTIVRRLNAVVYIRPDLRRAAMAGTPVGGSPCQAQNLSTGLAAGLLNQVAGTTGAATHTQTLTKIDPYGVHYRFQRTMGIVNQAPYNLLILSYALQTQTASTRVDPFTTVVLPQAALYCP